MDAYRDKIQFKSEAGDYTEETYTEYKEAYDALMALDSSTGNVSADEFQAAKARFENAQAALKMIKADYTKVDEALAKVPADLSIYTDATVKTLKDAIAKVDRNQPLSKQAEVDAYADAIHDAINNLVVNPSLMMERITRTVIPTMVRIMEIQQVMEMDRAKEMAHPLTEQSRPEILHRSQEHLH